MAGRDSNVLTFDIQEELSPDPAAWMRDYYRYAREIHRTAVREVETSEQTVEGGLIRSFRDWRGRLSNADFTVTRERVFLKSPQQLTTDPDLVLRIFEFVARHGVRLSLEAERRMSEHGTYLAEYFQTKRPLWPAVRRVLSLPHSALALRTMQETGLLHILLPAWENIECLVVRDFFHRYTVDEHTLVTIEYLEELRATRDPARKRFQELLGETPDIALLYVALLFHDTGKSEGFDGHALASAQLAKRVLTTMKMPLTDQRLVLFLIEQHLALSAVMHGRDLNDPATARELAARVGTLERLKYLTLLTYADISAVNPDAMTPWRMEQLWRTYLIAHRELTKDLENERIHEQVPSGIADFLEGFPTRYLRTHTEEEIRGHQELARQSESSGAAVDLACVNGTWQLTVLTKDREGLFASLAGTLASLGMNIVRAEAFANARNIVLDMFVFEDPARTLELNPPEVERLKKMAQGAALGKEDVAKRLRGRARTVSAAKRARVEPRVAFDSEASDAATLVEIVAFDRPGLLYDFARTFAEEGCSIDVVLIETQAHKAIDVFYVTRGGGKLDSETMTALKQKLLDVCNA
jgi:[protein-PII] uridylyltransferase